MASREIVISLKLSEGTTREQFRALKAALIELRTEVAENNKSLRENAKAQKVVDDQIKAGVGNIEALEAQTRVLAEERKQLVTTAANLVEAEDTLNVQYKQTRKDLGSLVEVTDSLRTSQIETVSATLRQRDALEASAEKAKQLSAVAKQLFAEFKKGDRTDESFHKLNSALNDTRAALTANKKALDINAKAEAELAAEVRLSGVATEEQAGKFDALTEERAQLQAVNSSLKITEGTLSAALRETGNDVKGLTEASLRFRDKMAQANREALEQSGILGQLGARMDFLRQEQDRLNKEYQEGKVTQDQYRASLEKLQAEEAQTAQATAALDTKLNALEQEFKEGRISAEEFRKATSAINSSVQANTTAIQQGVKDLKSYALGFVGIVAVAQKVGSVITNAGKTIAGFQQSNTNLAAILGTTRDKITQLTESALKIGPAFARAPEEVTALQTELAKLGFTVPEILAAQEAIIALANATGETLGKSAEVAAATLNGFNLTAEDTGRVVDVIAEAANRSSLDLEKFSTAMATVAPAAAQAGFSIEEATALIGVLTDRGVDASTAGTSLRSIFIDLANTGQSFSDAMAEINASTNKTNTAVALFQERASGAALILAEAGKETNDLTEALNNAGGAAQKVADEQLNTLTGRVNKLSSAWDAFILSLENGEGALGKTIDLLLRAGTAALNFLTTDEAEKRGEEFAKGVRDGFVKVFGSEATVDINGSFLDITQQLPELEREFQTAANETQKVLGEGRSAIIARIAAYAKEAQQILSLGDKITNDERVRLAIILQGQKLLQDGLKELDKASEESAAKRGKASGVIVAATENEGKSIDDLKKKLKEEKDARDALTDETQRAAANERIASLKEQIKELEATSTATNNTAGSVADLSAQIAELQKQQVQSTSSEQFDTYQAQIDALTQSVDVLIGKLSQDLVDAAATIPQSISTRNTRTEGDQQLLPLTPQDQEAAAQEVLSFEALLNQQSLEQYQAYIDERLAKGQFLNEEEQRLALENRDALLNIEAAKAEALSAAGSILVNLAKQGSEAAKIGLALEKAGAIASVLINLQREIAGYSAAAAAQSIYDPTAIARGAVLSVAAKVRAATSIGIIAAQAIQGFDKGGVIQRTDGKPIRRRNGDNVLITARAGEVILNEDQQDELRKVAGHDIFGRIGVPGHKPSRARDIIQGFATGGHITRGTALVNIAAPDLIQIESAATQSALADRPVVAHIEEIVDVLERRMSILEMSRG